MGLLRFILYVVLVYLSIKFIGRWIAGRLSPGPRAGDEKKGKGNEAYGKFTDQTIDDAEFEEINPGDEK